MRAEGLNQNSKEKRFIERMRAWVEENGTAQSDGEKREPTGRDADKKRVKSFAS